MRYGIIGCGLIGAKRALALKKRGDELIGVCDLDPNKATKTAETFQAVAFPSPKALFASDKVEAVIIATSNDVASELALEAMSSGKHVLIEKPAGRNPTDLGKLVALAKKTKTICRIGFNHRFHPGLQLAKVFLESSAIGDLLYFRARYGHGGRKGYDREWRADPKRGGGGELLDQGIHLVDLCRWFGGEFALEFGSARTLFWDMPVEDNGFLFLRSPNGERSAWLHASCTEWKNTFDFEIFGNKGKIQITGLGGSYGKETVYLYKRQPESGPPDLEKFDFPEEDLSWEKELEAFQGEINGKKTDLGRPEDALRAIEIIYDCYRESGATWI